MICTKFTPDQRNNLLGFADIEVAGIIIIKEVAIHRHNTAWANPPARPVVRDGQLIRDERGKIVHEPVVAFPNKDARDLWSTKVIEAVRAHPVGGRLFAGE